VIGSLIVQDIVAILMMVLIYRGSKSTIFRNRVSVVRAETDFLPNYLVCQRDIFHSYPTQKKPNLLTDEMMLIISLALCLMMVILASNVGFSPALGAFIMGSIIAETTQAEHIEHLIKPVKTYLEPSFRISRNVNRSDHAI
jgi:CPA2 family monovalent cation:H+ antiporter-2